MPHIREHERRDIRCRPLRFWPRLKWLDQVEITAGKETDWAGHVRGTWENGDALPAGRAWAELNARSIIRGFGACPWVATVTVQGNDIGRSMERAHTAVRLAINALGLVMHHTLALKLRGPGDELRPTEIVRVSQVSGQDIDIGQGLDLPRLAGPPNFAENIVFNTVSYRDATGKAIEAIVTASPTGGTPELCRRWCDALFWFGEARRDTAEFMALVRYGMTLDILAKGKQAPGITTLLSALLAIPGDHAFLRDGTTLKKTVKQIYEEGRSQFGHGGRRALLEDLPFSREGADMIVSNALVLYVLCLSLYSGADTYKDFLRAIPNILPKIIR